MWRSSHVLAVAAAIILSRSSASASDIENPHTTPDCSTAILPAPAEWVKFGGFALIILGILVMFWGLTFVCEEYCVPAISVICLRHKISDVFAGSTVIGAGLSLPVLFASYVGLFGSDSSIGFGTVVGGNIFNQTLNLAFGIFVAPNRRLLLCKVVLAREVIAYALSNILILWVVEPNLHRAFTNILSSESLSRCLAVPWHSSLFLVGLYFAYCVMEAYFLDTVRALYRWRRGGTVYGPDFLPSSPPVSSAIAPERFVHRSPSPALPSSLIDISLNSQQNSGLIAKDEDVHETTIEEGFNCADSLNSIEDQPTVEPVDLNDFVLIKRDECILHNFMSSEVWQQRFCTMHDEGYMSYRTKRELPQQGRHARFVDLSHERGVEIVDAVKFEFSLSARHPNCRTFVFRAVNEATFKAVIGRMQLITSNLMNLPLPERRLTALNAMNELTFYKKFDWGASKSPESFGSAALADSMAEGKAFTPPQGKIRLILYYVVHPLRLAIYYSTPDVRMKGSEHKAFWSLGMCIFWMAAASYMTTLGLSELGNLIKVNGVVMGLTAGAWAAAYPALWSSVVVARDGQGDMVCGNALGSNVFNNYIGLGLPWLTYSLVYGLRPYGGIQDGGIVLAFVILTAVLLLFHAVVAFNDYEMRSWMAWALCAAYIGCTVYLCFLSW